MNHSNPFHESLAEVVCAKRIEADWPSEALGGSVSAFKWSNLHAEFVSLSYGI